MTRGIAGFRDPVNSFSGDFFETSATIKVTATTTVSFAQIGRETNGVFF